LNIDIRGIDEDIVFMGIARGPVLSTVLLRSKPEFVIRRGWKRIFARKSPSGLPETFSMM